MDANENDIPPAAGFRVQGFPTIKFRAAGSSEFIDYEGDRSLESFIEFAETHGKNGAKPDAPAKSAKVAATAAADHHDELCKFTSRAAEMLTKPASVPRIACGLELDHIGVRQHRLVGSPARCGQ